jgi:hypothetical protein
VIDPQNTAITISGELVKLIQDGKAVSLGLMVYDVEADRLVIVGFVPEIEAMLLKFNIASWKVAK